MNTYSKPVSIIPENDTERLQKLHKYEILDTYPEETFDKVAILASQIFNTPIAFVTFVDKDRVFFKSNIGLLKGDEVARAGSLCSLAILENGTTVFNDTHQVPDLMDNPYVNTDEGIRFYAGSPLKTTDGFRLGTISVVDTVPHLVNEKQVQMLETLSSIIMDELELRLITRTAMRVQTDIMNLIVHDIKNPLTTITLYSALIGQRSTEPAIKLMAGKIGVSTERILNDLNALLELSKIENGRLTLNFEEVDIVKLLQKVVSNLNIMAQQKRQTISFQHHGSRVVQIDKGRMQEVFENLLSNAIKYAYHHTVIDVFIHDEESLVIEIRDQGQGLTDQDMERLFLKFAKLSAIPTNKERSSGLGLSISKTLVELHNGKIWATSPGKDKGSSFFVSLAHTRK